MPSRRRSDSSPQRRHPTPEAIANRAYELFLARGAEHGHDLDDWLQQGKGYRSPADIISRCVWLYYRFGVSLRDVSE